MTVNYDCGVCGSKQFELKEGYYACVKCISM